MSKTNAQLARAQFDDKDAQAVTYFFQQKDDDPDAERFHRGYRRRELAALVLGDDPLPMILTHKFESHAPDNEATPFQRLMRFAERANELAVMLDQEPNDLFFDTMDAGPMLAMEFQWNRPATDVEKIAAKAWLRDNPQLDHPKKKMWNVSASTSSFAAGQAAGVRIGAQLNAVGGWGEEAVWDNVAVQPARVAEPEPAPVAPDNDGDF